MKADRAAEIVIYEDIGEGWVCGGVSANSFATSLASLGPVDSIDVRISSNGGDVFAGLTIYNALKNHGAKINVFIDGIAASIATVIAMAGDVITMAENAIFMIHEPSCVSVGTADDMLATAALLETVTTSSVGIYAARSRMSESDIRSAMKQETWYSAEDAKKAGFIDAISPNKALSASFELKQFAKAPEWVQQRLQSFQFKGTITMADTTSGAGTTDTTSASPDVETLKTQVASLESQLASLKSDLEAAMALLAEQKGGETEVDSAEMKAQGVKQERERQTKIAALCAQAKRPGMAAKLCEDEAMTIELAQQKLFAALCADSKPIGDEGGAAGDEKKKDDGNDKYRQEFKNTPAYAKDFTEDEYVQMRRIDDGLDSLQFTKAT
jgi:ATP-dependent protease ClpP protease subunit